MVNSNVQRDSARAGASADGPLHTVIEWLLFPISAGLVTNSVAAIAMGLLASGEFLDRGGASWRSALSLSAVVIAALFKLRAGSRK